MKIGCSDFYFVKEIGREKTIELFSTLGIDCIDINFSFDDCLLAEDFEEKASCLKKILEKYGVFSYQAHAPFPVYDNNEEYNQKYELIFKRIINCCSILGIRNLVIHPYPYWTIEECNSWASSFLDLCKEKNVCICYENVWLWDNDLNIAKDCLGSSPNSLLNLCENARSDFVRACVDIGHASMFPQQFNAYDMIKVLGNKYVKCLHIHDNDLNKDLHLAPYEGNIDWESVIKALKEINFTGVLSLEPRKGKYQSFNLFIEYVRYIIESINHLIKMLGEKND